MLRAGFLIIAALPLTAQVQPLIFDQVDVFDGYRMLRSQTVVVQDGIIRDIRPSSVVSAAGTAINGRGKTLLPGLIDAHCHIAGEESLEQAAALGITTELDMFGYPNVLMPIRRALARGEYPNAADFRTAGIGANVPGGHPSEMSGSPPFPALAKGVDPQAFVDARVAEGADYLKILYDRYDHTLPGLTLDQLRALVAAAHRRNKLAAVHETVQRDGLEAIEGGADEIEHVFDDSPIAPEFVRLAADNHVTITPTLAVISTFGGVGTGPELAADTRFSPYLLSSAADTLNTKLPEKILQKHHYENAQAAVRALHQACPDLGRHGRAKSGHDVWRERACRVGAHGRVRLDTCGGLARRHCSPTARVRIDRPRPHRNGPSCRPATDRRRSLAEHPRHALYRGRLETRTSDRPRGRSE